MSQALWLGSNTVMNGKKPEWEQCCHTQARLQARTRSGREQLVQPRIFLDLISALSLLEEEMEVEAYRR